MADVELSTAREDRLEVAMTKLVVAQLRLESTLDAFLLKLPLRTSHHYPSSSSVQSPPSPPPSTLTAPSCPVPMQHNQSPLSTLLPTSTPSPMSTPPPMPTPPPPPTLIQSHPTPLSAPLPIAVVPLLANSNPHASSDHRWITIFQVRKEYPNRCKELDHSFLFYATINIAK
ncbi:hypothetical protein GmHk_02G003991 [Glycine max]|nr:hypothetical protein GmHk_02G003991 [Glycine max]